MKHRKRHPTTNQHASRLWRPRASGRHAVALRVDYATADGRVWLGLIRNLSLQRMYIDRTSSQVTAALEAGALLTAAFVLPSGRPCKLWAVVVHGNRHGCGVQFREVPPQSFEHLASYWSSLEEAQ